MITPEIPEDTSALIIAGPRRSLERDEIEIIADYLENGGKALILINPESPPEIQELLSAWGVEIEAGTIIDPSSYAAPSIDSPSVPALRNFFGFSITYFPGATAIIPQAGYTAQLVGLEAGIIP